MNLLSKLRKKQQAVASHPTKVRDQKSVRRKAAKVQKAARKANRR